MQRRALKNLLSRPSTFSMLDNNRNVLTRLVAGPCNNAYCSQFYIRLHQQIGLRCVHSKVCNDRANSDSSNVVPDDNNSNRRLKILNDGRNLTDFMGYDSEKLPSSQSSQHYLPKSYYTSIGRKVYFETYGCQMNVNDMDIVWSILNTDGFTRTNELKQADVVLLMTCSIREGAEKRIWNRVDALQSLKRHRKRSLPPLKIGILGCMAERLKEQILEKKRAVDLVCGPDAYKDLPRLLSVTQTGQTAVNVLLSLEETYADVMPVRMDPGSPSAFVSIMRGCDNMCSYCIVPFTRGRERSRPISSICDEVRMLRDQGIKEVTLLGQNVNSYRDLSEYSSPAENPKTPTSLAKGFKTIYRTKLGGLRFADLLDKVSSIDPEMRIRFTSPHPKDFPDEVLELVKERPSICNQIHIPAQSGSTSVLEAMRRGYTREAYIDLIHHIKEQIPDIRLSSDFIAGFCGETDSDHKDTLTLLELVRYHRVFHFPYSLREKTHAHRRLRDDVPNEVKQLRHEEIATLTRRICAELNAQDVGSIQLVLIESESKRSRDDWSGRNDGNTKVIFPKAAVPAHISSRASSEVRQQPKVGDYVAVKILSSTSQTLRGVPLYISSIHAFDRHCESHLPNQELEQDLLSNQIV